MAKWLLATFLGVIIFNILMVLGITSIIHPLNITEPIHPDLLMATGLTCLLFILTLRGKHSLGKISGVILLITYFLYIVLKGIGKL